MQEILTTVVNLRALNQFNLILEILPDELMKKLKSDQLYIERANAYKELRITNIAIIDCTEAIKIDSTIGYYFFLRGSSWQDRKEYKMAIQDYKIAKRLNFDLTQLKNKLSSCYYEIAILENSISLFLKAIEYNSENMTAWKEVGKIWLRNKKFNDAISAFKKCNENYELSNAYYLRSCHNSSIDEYKLAFEDINGAINAFEVPIYFYERAILWLITSNNVNEAVSDLQKINHVSNQNIPLLINNILKNQTVIENLKVPSKKNIIKIIELYPSQELSKKILIYHPDQIYAFSIGKYLNLLNYTIKVVENEDLLLPLSELFRPDIFITHNHTSSRENILPSIFKRLRQENADIIIVVNFTTGSIDEESDILMNCDIVYLQNSVEIRSVVKLFEKLLNKGIKVFHN